MADNWDLFTSPAARWSAVPTTRTRFRFPLGPSVEVARANARATLESVTADLPTRLTMARQRLECARFSLLLIRISSDPAGGWSEPNCAIGWAATTDGWVYSLVPEARRPLQQEGPPPMIPRGVLASLAQEEWCGRNRRNCNWAMSGCGAEHREFETAEHLLRVLAFDLIVAWRLLACLNLGRALPPLPARILYTQDELAVLSATFKKSPSSADFDLGRSQPTGGPSGRIPGAIQGRPTRSREFGGVWIGMRRTA